MVEQGDQLFIDGIRKTGFVLEHKICSILEEHNWSVINNRYYLDDLQEVDREIDIIAYKVREKIIKEELIYFYTSLIISCKKSEENVWAMLTKDIKRNDPNMEINPLSNWTNHKILEFMFEKQNVQHSIEQKLSSTDFLKEIYEIPRQVFAFQQLKINSGKPNNDKPIFESIKSSIKALEYERQSLCTRKKSTVFYDFNLLSVFEGDMKEFYFSNGKEDISVSNIQSIKYLNRHIVNKIDRFYRVHFIDASKFDDIIKNYDELHIWNSEFYSGLIEKYHDDVTEFGNDGFNLIKEKFESKVIRKANKLVVEKFEPFCSIEFEYKSSLKKLLVGFHSTDAKQEVVAVEVLQASEDLKKYMKQQLFETYNYNGKFEIESGLYIGLPF